ncbi:MAG: hemerythrin family protein [Betaproteobacteria bacterium]|nr:hemerythrin family protein [Betaproteobacteria bacterium]
MRIENPTDFWAGPAPHSGSRTTPRITSCPRPMGENMAWTRDFCVGIPEIDQQHRILFDCVLLMEDSLTEGAARSTLQSVLEQLVNFARMHFADEETSMRNHRYPGLEKHAEEHLQFMGNLRDLQERLQRADVAKEAIFFVENRLLEHTLSSDREFASWLADAGARGEGGHVLKTG